MLGISNISKTRFEPKRIAGYNMTRDTKFTLDISSITEFDNLTGYTVMIWIETMGCKENSSTNYSTPFGLGTTNNHPTANVGYQCGYKYDSSSSSTSRLTMDKYDGSDTVKNENIGRPTYHENWGSHTAGQWKGAGTPVFAVAQIYADTDDAGNEYNEYIIDSRGVASQGVDEDADDTGHISVSNSEIRINDNGLLWDYDQLNKGVKVLRVSWWNSALSSAWIYRMAGLQAGDNTTHRQFHMKNRFWNGEGLNNPYNVMGMTQPDHEWDFTRVSPGIATGIDDTGADSEGGDPGQARDLSATGAPRVVYFYDPCNGQGPGLL